MNAQLETHIHKAAQVLVSFGAKEVYVFGSQATGESSQDSDVDLAVRGLPDEVFFKAYARASLECPRELDLISLDDANPFTDFILKEGPLVRIA